MSIKKIIFILGASFIIGFTPYVYSAIQGNYAVSVVDSTNSTRFWTVPGDATNGMWVNVKTGTIASITNPVTVIQPAQANLLATVYQTTASNLNMTAAQPTASLLNATVIGNVGNNAGAPGTNNIGVNPAVANAANPTYTEGNETMLSQDLKGNLRVRQTQVSTALTSTNAAATQEVIPLTAAQSIKVYSAVIDTVSGGITNVNFVYGTGLNCGTGTNNITNLITLTTTHETFTMPSSIMPWFVVPAGNALCIVNSAATQIYLTVGYIKE